MTSARSILWFRRDLRLADHEALTAAAARGQVLGVFVLDPAFDRSGAPRRAFLAGCLAALSESTGGALVVRRGKPAEVLPQLAAEAGATAVLCSDDFGPYGRRRDAEVEAALAAGGVALERVGSVYAVAPGTVRKPTGQPFRVYSPFYRAWREQPVGPPLPVPDVDWVRDVPGEGVPAVPALERALRWTPGEAAARRRLDEFLASGLAGYADRRNEPGVDGTSRLSPHLRWGCLHPRTVLAALRDGAGDETFRKELAWREFYADVLLHRPESAWSELQPHMAELRVDEGPEADARFDAWVEGRTGFPAVDAAMRQLATEGWVHNRMRMVAASFLCKDLHLPWQRGARLFLERLVDGDLASNNHGWQWVAGTGTDPAPYFRVFNPVLQGQKFDPDGDYVRTYVPELAHLAGKAVHEPWKAPGGLPAGYPPPMVDHKAEREEALRRYAEVSS